MHHRIVRTFFFRTKFDSVIDILLDNGIFTDFELHFSEFLRQFLRQLRHEATEQYLPEIKDDSSQTKDLLPAKYCRTVTKRKSIKKVAKGLS